MNLSIWHIFVLISLYISVRKGIDLFGILKFPFAAFISYVLFGSVFIWKGVSPFVLFVYVSGWLVLPAVSYLNIKRNIPRLVRYVALLGVVSALLLLLQTFKILSWYPSDIFYLLGLVDASDYSLTSNLNLRESRGFGLSETVTNYAYHSILPIVYCSLVRFKWNKLFLLILLVAAYKNASSALFLSLLTIVLLIRFKNSGTLSKKLMSLLVLTSVIIVAFRLNSLIHSVEGDSLVSRVVVWSRSLGLWLNNPFFGVGIGNVQNMLSSQAGLFEFRSDFQVAVHSWFWDVLAGTGSIGIFLFILGLIQIWQLPLEDKLEKVLFYTFFGQMAFGLVNNTFYMQVDHFFVLGLLYFYKRKDRYAKAI